MTRERHVVMFSSGAGSWAAAKRVAERHGTDNLWLVFSDVLGEDEDNYRFLTEAAANVGGELVWLKEGRDIWQVFRDNRFLGNSRLANCSKFLKQQPAREWLDANCDPETTTVYVGIDWTEQHRLPAVERGVTVFGHGLSPQRGRSVRSALGVQPPGVDRPRSRGEWRVDPLREAGSVNGRSGSIRAGQGLADALLTRCAAGPVRS